MENTIKLSNTDDLVKKQIENKKKLHHDLLEFIYFNQYNEYDNRCEIYPSLDRWIEYNYDGSNYWCYSRQ